MQQDAGFSPPPRISLFAQPGYACLSIARRKDHAAGKWNPPEVRVGEESPAAPMRAAIARILGNHGGARNVDPLAIDLEPDLPALPQVDEVIRRPAIAVVAAWRAGGIPVRGVVHAAVVDVTECGEGAECEKGNQGLDLHRPHRSPH